MKLKFGKWDALAVTAVVLLAVLGILLLLQPAPGTRAKIYQNGRLIKTVSLRQDQVFTLPGSYNATVTVKDGAIAVTASDCPGGDCLRSGWLKAGGRSIVCLPGGLEIRVVGEADDVDFVVG